MTDKVKEQPTELNIECVYVPANMTHFFQPLDLTVNGCAKQRMKKQFVTYYSSAVKQQLDSGKQLEDIEVDFRLSVPSWRGSNITSPFINRDSCCVISVTVLRSKCQALLSKSWA